MALGRGLGELLGEIETAYENSSDMSNNNILELSTNMIKPNPYQPRKVFDEAKLQELSDSIVKNGLLQPIVVTKDGNKYLLIAGERRLRATMLANINKIKVVLLDVDDSKLRELALIENIQRDDLNIIEVAYSYAGLINEHNITHEELSNLVSKSRSSITNTLRLLTLSSATQKVIANSQITLGHAKIIVGLTEDEQKIVVDSIIGQKLSVRETELLVKDIKNKANSNEEVIITSKKVNFNYKSFNNISTQLKNNNLNVKFDDKYFKIEIKSQDDIEKIAEYFNK